MELSQFYHLIKHNMGTLVMSVLVFVVISASITFFQPLDYRAESRLLIIQNSQEGTDPFVAAKANEYLGGVLVKIVSSNSFLDEVLSSGMNINKDNFSLDRQKRASAWQNMVVARSFGDLGVIEISIFNPDKYQAEQIAQAVNSVLKDKSSIFLGTGDKISLKIIDQPIVSNWPVRPNIPLNLLLGPIFGLVFGLFYLYLFGRVVVQPAIKEAIEQAAKDEPSIPSEPMVPSYQPVVLPVAEMQPQYAATQAQAPVEQVAPEAQHIFKPIQPPVPVQQPVQPPVQPAPSTIRPPISSNSDFDLDDILNQGNMGNLL